MRWPIVSELCCLHTLVLQHDIKKLATVTPSLHRAVNIKIKHTHRFYLFDFSTTPTNEQLLYSNLQETNALIALSSHKDDVTIGAEFPNSSDLTGQSLCLIKKFKNSLITKITYFCTCTTHRINNLNKLGMMVSSLLLQLVAMNDRDTVLRISSKLLHKFLNIEPKLHV